MPVYRVDLTGEASLRDVYATKATPDSLPKHQWQKGRTKWHASTAFIRNEQPLNGTGWQNLAEPCITRVEDGVRQMEADAIDKNALGIDEFPRAAEGANPCAQIVADLWPSQSTQWRTPLPGPAFTLDQLADDGQRMLRPAISSTRAVLPFTTGLAS